MEEIKLRRYLVCANCDNYFPNSMVPRCRKYNIESKPWECCYDHAATPEKMSRVVPIFPVKEPLYE